MVVAVLAVHPGIQEDLNAAIAAKAWDRIDSYVAAGADVTGDGIGPNPLLNAVKRGDIITVLHLLPFVVTLSPEITREALFRDNRDILALLSEKIDRSDKISFSDDVDAHEQDDEDLLRLAIHFASPACVHLLLDCGATVALEHVVLAQNRAAAKADIAQLKDMTAEVARAVRGAWWANPQLPSANDLRQLVARFDVTMLSTKEQFALLERAIYLVDPILIRLLLKKGITVTKTHRIIADVLALKAGKRQDDAKTSSAIVSQLVRQGLEDQEVAKANDESSRWSADEAAAAASDASI